MLVYRNIAFLAGVPEAQLLISPEIRGTFLDNDYPTVDTTNELDFDQIAYGLPTASGKGENTIESLPPIDLESVFEVEEPLTLATLRTELETANPDMPKEEMDTLIEIFKYAREEGDFLKVLKKLKKDS